MMNKLFIVEPGCTKTTETIIDEILPFLKDPKKTVLYIGEVMVQHAVLRNILLKKMNNDTALILPKFTTVEDIFKRGPHRIIGNEERIILLMFLVEKYTEQFKTLLPKSGLISIPFAQQLLRLFDNIRLYLSPLDLEYLRKQCQIHLETYPKIYNRAIESIRLFELYRDFLQRNDLADSIEMLLKYEINSIPSWWNYDLIVIDGLKYTSPLHAQVLGRFLVNHLQRGKHLVSLVYDVPEINGLISVKRTLMQSFKEVKTPYQKVRVRAHTVPKTRVYSFTSMEDEVSWVARQIKEIAISSAGNMPKVLITSPSVYRYLPYIEKGFRDYGITIGRQFGPPLTLHPFVQFILQSLDIVSENYMRFDTISLFSSPYFKLDNRDKDEIDTASLKYPILGTKKQWIDFLNSSNRGEVSLSLTQRQYISKFLQFQEGIDKNEKLPFNSYLSHIKGFIEEFSDTSKLNDMSVMETLLSSFNTLEEISETIGNPRISLTGFKEILFSTLRQKRLPEPEVPPPEHPILFVGFEQVTHIPHDYLFVFGFDEDAYPHDLADWRIFPDKLRKSLGFPHQDQIFDIQEHRFNSLSRSPREACYITFVSMKENRQVMPSIFIDPKKVETPPYSKWRLKRILSLKEKQRFIGLSTGVSFNDVKKQNLEKLVLQSIEVFSKQMETLSVTDLEYYAKCPMIFIYQRVLKIEPVHEPEPVVDVLKEGTWFHKVMEIAFNKVKESNGMELSEDVYEGIAKGVSEKLGIFPLWHKYLVNRYREPFSIIVEEFESQSDEVSEIETEYWLESEIKPGYRLKGKADRIDIFETGGFRVIDYKTSNTTTKYQKAFNYAKEGKFLQLPLYAYMFQLQRGGYPTEMVLFTWYQREIYLKLNIPHKDTEFILNRIINAAINKSIEIIDSIREGKFYPKPSRECNRCRFKSLCPEFMR